MQTKCPHRKRPGASALQVSPPESRGSAPREAPRGRVIVLRPFAMPAVRKRQTQPIRVGVRRRHLCRTLCAEEAKPSRPLRRNLQRKAVGFCSMLSPKRAKASSTPREAAFAPPAAREGETSPPSPAQLSAQSGRLLPRFRREDKNTPGPVRGRRRLLLHSPRGRANGFPLIFSSSFYFVLFF